MKSQYTGLFIALVLAANLYLANGISRYKAINQPLTIPCHCEEGLQCRWYYQDQQAVPDYWVQANGNLDLPADDWTVYGGITRQCGSYSNVYTVTIMNTGEVCDTCLQLYFTSPVDNICVGSVANVTVSTNQSHSHGDAITLHANSSVCSSNYHRNDVVRCHEHGSVIGHTLSYTITAIDAGTVTIRAHTNYYGATWYSNSEKLTVVEWCNESDDIITTPGTSVSTTDVMTAAPSGEATTNDNTSSKEVPTDSTDDSSSGGGVPEEPTSKVNISQSGNKEDDESAIIIIGITCTVPITTLVILSILIYCCWKYRKRKKLTRIETQGQQPAPVSLCKLITGLPSCKGSSQEDCCC